MDRSGWASSRRHLLLAAGAKVRFAISGDADATPGPERQARRSTRFGVYARMAAERNDFNINLGDTIYSDSEVGGAPVARTVREKWGKYKLGLALPALRKLRASAGLYSHWDDHEFINDFSRAENGGAIYAAGVKAFTDYAPVAKPSATGLYRTFRWGKHLELFFLDERSFRSRQGDGSLQRRSRTDRTAGGARRVLDTRARPPEPRRARLPRGDQRSGAHDARRAPVRGVHEGDQGVERRPGR